MALQYTSEVLRAQGIGSPYASVEELYIPDPMNASRLIIDSARAMLPWSDIPMALLNMKAYQEKFGAGCSGWGMDVGLLWMLLPTLYWFLGIMAIRYVCRSPLARFGIYLGVVTENSACHRRRVAAGRRGVAALSSQNQKKIMKFQNQLWLSIFYVVSSYFGYCVQRGEPWFKFPLSNEAMLSILVPHPHNPSKALLVYYHYGLGFYLAELCSLLFFERHMKRSDFFEYIMHHIMTIALMVFSHIGIEHRVGAYVLFIHDASDIMLCVSKALHYMLQEDTARQTRYNKKHAKHSGKTYRQSLLYKRFITESSVNGCFGVFVVCFFFFRLYCLPHIGKGMLFIAPKVRHGNLNMWMLFILLNFALQGLHVYWASLIIMMILTLATGGERKDIRSGDDDDCEIPSCVHWGQLSESDDDDDDAQRGRSNGKHSTSSPKNATFSSPAQHRNGSPARSASKKRQQQQS